MKREEELKALTGRVFEHYKAGTTDQAPDTLTVPLTAYIDEARYEREVHAVFRQLPLALALTVQLPEPGSYRAMTVAGVPVLLARGDDGVARAFLNVCRHRGAQLCADGDGTARSFSCPYHAWNYDLTGALVKRYAADTFGPVDHASRPLVQLPCAERSGLIWAVLDPDAELDVDGWLGEFQAELGQLELDTWYVFAERVIPGPGWKVTMDGYLEAYHHNIVHGATVGKHTVGNLLVLDTYGPHQRMTFGRRTAAELEGVTPDAWPPLEHIRLIHSGFPNLSISGILGDHCLVSHIFPGETSAQTVTRQTVLSARKPETAEELAASEAFSAMVLEAVRDEDYALGFNIQDRLHSGANREFILGRNEPAVQNYHRWVTRFATEQGADWRTMPTDDALQIPE